jgi:DNA polymerase/3'-5' exonuclease PolX
VIERHGWHQRGGRDAHGEAGEGYSAGFNIMCRSRAIRLGYSLSQHGLFKGDQLVASATEDEILGILGMEWALDPAKRSR